MPLTKKKQTQLFGKLEVIVQELQGIVEEFQAHVGEHAEKWQESEAGQEWQAYIEHLEQAIAELEAAQED